MMSNEANERLQRDTQHVPLRQNTEEKVTEESTRLTYTGLLGELEHREIKTRLMK